MFSDIQYTFQYGGKLHKKCVDNRYSTRVCLNTLSTLETLNIIEI